MMTYYNITIEVGNDSYVKFYQLTKRKMMEL